MKKPLNAKNGRACLERVAEHLYRHQLNGSYYGIIKIAGKQKVQALRVSPDLAPTTDSATAKRLLREWEDKLSRVDHASGDMRLDALLAKYAASRTGKAKSTQTTEAAFMSRFREEFGRNEEGRRVFGMEQMVSRVKPSDISIFLAGLANGIRNASFNRYRLILRKIFLFAVDDRVIAQSPFIEGRNKPKKKQKVFRNIPTAEEFEAIINDIRTPTVRPTKGKHGGLRLMSFPESADFAEFQGRAGLGQAEAIGLKWGHVDFSGKPRMKIIRKKTEEYYEVPIYDNLMPLMERLHREAKDTSPDAPVFAIESAHKALMNACKRLGLPHFTERNLRGMKIRELYDTGVDIKMIARWQGHQDGGRLIMSTYTEIFRSTDSDYEDQQLAKANGKIIPFAAKAA